MPFRKIPALEIKALAHNGSGIGFIDSGVNTRGKAVFVQGALPGQTVSCEIVLDKRNFFDARLISVLSSEFQAERELCIHWHECGSCPLQPMPYERQLFWKERLVRDAFERIGKFPAPKLDIQWARPGSSLAMPLERNKVELAFGIEENGSLTIGFRKRASHQVFQLRKCAVLADNALPIIESFRQFALKLKITPQILRFLTLRKASDASCTVLLLTGACHEKDRMRIQKMAEALLQERDEVEQFLHEERSKSDLLALGEKRIFHLRKNAEKGASMPMSLGGRKFLIDPASFFQVNPAGAECLAKVIVEQDALSGPLLDLYCGSGSPGQLLAERHESCLGIEQDTRAIMFASKNCRDLHGWNYVAAKVESTLAKKKIKHGSYATALVDPPRAGIAGLALERLMEAAPEQIIYVSCNPATAARDAAGLQKNYLLENIRLVDMFPDTSHVECCAVWRKRT